MEVIVANVLFGLCSFDVIGVNRSREKKIILIPPSESCGSLNWMHKENLPGLLLRLH